MRAEVSTSDRCGTSVSVTVPRHSTDAAMMGSTLFFAPGIRTSPKRAASADRQNFHIPHPVS
jgi:hypothetical protein